ncbi:MAG: response regulator transcription factor [Candidatus Binatia bacterium]|nr:response regulator transcription factor [Candidatus Binatia bacterium]
MAELDRSPPAVLLTDIGLPNGSGIDLIREVRARDLPTQPMVITVFGDEKHVVAAIEAGALGYVLKDGSADYIRRFLLDLVAGGSPISPPIARYFLRRFRTPGAEPSPEPWLRRNRGRPCS